MITTSVSLKHAFLLMPAAFIIHDVEELSTMPARIDDHRAQSEPFAARSQAAAELIGSLPVATKQTGVATGSLLISFVAVTAGAAVAGERGFRLYACAALLGASSLHVLTHLAQAVYFGAHAPGVVDAVIVVIPVAGYIYKRLFDERLPAAKSAVLTALIGIALFVPGALPAQQIGRIFGGE